MQNSFKADQNQDKVDQFKQRMNTLAYGEAMMAAARDYGQVRSGANIVCGTLPQCLKCILQRATPA
jgi:hypothetical protein